VPSTRLYEVLPVVPRHYSSMSQRMHTLHMHMSKKDRTSSANRASDTVPGRQSLWYCQEKWNVLFLWYSEWYQWKDVTYGDSSECCYTCALVTHPYGCIITKERDGTTPMVDYDPMAYIWLWPMTVTWSQQRKKRLWTERGWLKW